MKAVIRAIAHQVPERVLDNEELARLYPDWSADKIQEKTGFRARRVVGPGVCASDLAEQAARKLFESGRVDRAGIDLLLFCTQSPDYFVPTTACTLQQRLGLPTTVAAFDYNLGCSGYVYGLAIAKGFLETGMARSALLLTGETYSRFIHPEDRSVRTIFGDAASATWLEAQEDSEPGGIGSFVFGTDGSGAENFIVPVGGMRRPHTATPLEETVDEAGNRRTDANLRMNGPEIFEFTLRQIPGLVKRTLDKARLAPEAIDWYVFHQANRYMLEKLRRSAKIDEARFLMGLEDCGNTVSSTIPMVLQEALDREQIRAGQKLMLVGFGVGYSWGACVADWT